MQYSTLDNKIKGKAYFFKILKNCDENSKFKIVSFVNPFSYLELLKKTSLINDVDCFFADGALLKTFHNLFHRKDQVERLSFDFSSIANDVLKWCESTNKKVAIVGAEPEEIEIAIKNLLELFPALNIVYSHDGYVKNKSVCELVQKSVIANKAEVLICGMGTPLQEEFLLKFKGVDSNLKLAFTCGGFITQTSMKPDYYHPFIKKTGLRWLQRVILHSHVRKRVMKDYPKFITFYIFVHIKKLLRDRAKN